MSAVKQIQCPACGANSTFKQTDGSYRCNYCQSNFELKENLNRPQAHKTTVTFNPNVKPGKMGCGLGVVMALVAMIGVGVAVFINFRQNPAIAEGVESVLPDGKNLHSTIMSRLLVQMARLFGYCKKQHALN